MVTAEALYNFANSLSSGHVKFYKAAGMVNTVTRIPGILEEDGRAIKFIKNCLEMEGFSANDCEKVANFIRS